MYARRPHTHRLRKFPEMFHKALHVLAPWVLLVASSAFAVSGCASAGNFTWFKDIPNSGQDSELSEYTIGVGDTVNIRVYEQENLSGTAKIRRDGRIALPLAGELMVAGKHPAQLAREIEGRLKEFVVTPRVTVNVEQSQPVTVTAVGEVVHVGTLVLEPPARLIEALAQAGGPSDYADKSRIFVLRQFPAFQRIRFTYDAILHNEGGSATFPLRTGDVVVVE
jgi:polysaccharide export outer membrane protein